MAPPRKRRQENDESTGVFLIVIALGALIFYDIGLVAMLVVGLLPTFSALLSDQSRYKGTRLRTVFAFNLTGLLPFFVEVYYDGQGLMSAVDQFLNLYFWLVVYGAAGLGSLALLAAPHISAVLMQAMAEDRLDRITKEQSKILGEWGEEVSVRKGNDSLF